MQTVSPKDQGKSICLQDKLDLFIDLYIAPPSDNYMLLLQELFASGKFSVNDAILHHANHPTLLHLAASAGKDDIIRFLLTVGADINSHDGEGNTPLHAAAAAGKLATAQLLLDQQAACVANLQGLTPIAIAVEHNHLQLAELILKHYVLQAVSVGDLEQIQTLIENKTAKSLLNESLVKQLFLAAMQEGSLKIVEYFLNLPRN